jgi:fatty-acyl-CoA synthase
VVHLSRGIDMRPGDAMLCALPLFGVFGLMTTLGALAGGGACVLLPVWDAEQAARAVERHRITHVIGADTMFDAMFGIEGVRFDSLRHGVQADFTGLVLPVTRRGDELGVAFSGTYGSSECYALMSLHPWDAPAEQRAQAGGIVTDETIEVRVVDPDTGHPLADGEAGEIQIRGPNVLACYLNNPEATARAFTADGWFRSGDLGHRSGPGFVYLARMGDSLRLRGFLVNPAEIEACLMTHPSVAGAQVVGATRPGQGDVAVAWVRASDSALDAVALEAALIAHCRARMASYKVPVRIALLDEFPSISGPNGTKIQKRVLRDWARELV